MTMKLEILAEKYGFALLNQRRAERDAAVAESLRKEAVTAARHAREALEAEAQGITNAEAGR
jgi:hypothetical protein